jgi:multiple sugar transport system permease protein
MVEFRGRARLFGYLGAVLACLITLLPFLWIGMVSIKRPIDIYTGTLKFVPTLNNYSLVLFSKASDFASNLVNSTIVAVGSTLGVLAVGTLAAYSLSRLKWPKWVTMLMLAWVLVFHMVPPITLVGPWYLAFRRVGLFDSLFGLMLAHIALNLPLGILLMLSFIQDVPQELEAAALIDGCGRVGAFFRVTLPLVAPGLAAAGILSFVFSWNEFAAALNLTARSSMTVPVAVTKFAMTAFTRHGEMAASSVIATIPALVLMFVGQRFIVKGMTLGALK